MGTKKIVDLAKIPFISSIIRCFQLCLNDLMEFDYAKNYKRSKTEFSSVLARKVRMQESIEQFALETN